MEPERWCRLTVRLVDGTELGDVVLDGTGRPDLAAIAALADLLLAARQVGVTLTLDGTSPRLLELVELTGLPMEKPPCGPGGGSPSAAAPTDDP